METIKRRKQYIRERFLLIGVVFAVVLAAVILFMNGHRNTGKELTFSYSNMQKTEGSELFEILADAGIGTRGSGSSGGGSTGGFTIRW